MFRRNSTRADSPPYTVDDRPSGSGQCRPLRAILFLLVIASSLAAACGITATTDDIDRAGPFSSRGRASGNVVGGYLTAAERRHRRFSRTHVDVLFRKLGNDFDANLMSVDKPPVNLTRIVSKSFMC